MFLQGRWAFCWLHAAQRGNGEPTKSNQKEDTTGSTEEYRLCALSEWIRFQEFCFFPFASQVRRALSSKSWLGLFNSQAVQVTQM